MLTALVQWEGVVGDHNGVLLEPKSAVLLAIFIVVPFNKNLTTHLYLFKIFLKTQIIIQNVRGTAKMTRK